MLDEETYKKELVRMWDMQRGNDYKGKDICDDIFCEDCPLSEINNNKMDGCMDVKNVFEIIKIVERWSKENPPKKYKVSRMEYDILKYLSDNTKHIYITRDEYNCVYLFDEEPKKSSGHWYGRGACSVSVFNELFQFVQWQDKEPTSIQDVLKNCEVMDDESI